ACATEPNNDPSATQDSSAPEHQRSAAGRCRLAQEELQPLTPLATPDLDRVQALLEDFPQFWRAETDYAEHRKPSPPYSATSGKTVGRSSPYKAPRVPPVLPISFSGPQKN